MSKPYDSTVKSILETDPLGWARLAGAKARRASLIDADISTVTGAADKVIRVEDPDPWLLHVDLQAGPDVALPRRGAMYNVLLDYRHDLPVHTVFILLHPLANLSNLPGGYERARSENRPHLRFEYYMSRLWELEPDAMLKGIGTVPLAPLSNVTAERMPGVIRKMDGVLRKKCKRKALRQEMWAATYVLMGLRFESVLINQLLQGVQEMEESTTYQYLLARGRKEEAQDLVLLAGTKKLGKPSRAVKKTIEAIEDVDRLDALTLKLFDVSSW